MLAHIYTPDYVLAHTHTYTNIHTYIHTYTEDELMTRSFTNPLRFTVRVVADNDPDTPIGQPFVMLIHCTLLPGYPGPGKTDVSACWDTGHRLVSPDKIQ